MRRRETAPPMPPKPPVSTTRYYIKRRDAPLGARRSNQTVRSYTRDLHIRGRAAVNYLCRKCKGHLWCERSAPCRIPPDRPHPDDDGNASIANRNTVRTARDHMAYIRRGTAFASETAHERPSADLRPAGQPRRGRRQGGASAASGSPRECVQPCRGGAAPLCRRGTPHGRDVVGDHMPPWTCPRWATPPESGPWRTFMDETWPVVHRRVPSTDRTDEVNGGVVNSALDGFDAAGCAGSPALDSPGVNRPPLCRARVSFQASLNSCR
jgi:hypothetical protein